MENNFGKNDKTEPTEQNDKTLTKVDPEELRIFKECQICVEEYNDTTRARIAFQSEFDKKKFLPNMFFYLFPKFYFQMKIVVLLTPPKLGCPLSQFTESS